MRKYLIFLFMLLPILTACDTFGIKVYGDADKVKKWQNVAVIEILISPPDAPTFPLIDAGIYKGNFNDIYGDVASFHDKSCDSMVTYFGKMLSEYSKANVQYGNSLFQKITKEDLKNAGILTFSPALDNEDFPKLSLPVYAYNFFDLSKSSHPQEPFDIDNIDAVQSQVRKICDYLKVDGVVVGTVAVNTINVSMFGASGDRELFVDYYFFDKNGENVCSGKITSSSSSDSPDDIDHYIRVFNKYYSHSDMFLRKLYLGEEPESTKDDKNTAKMSKKSQERRKSK
ncbi:MAG: hypothetical protein ACM3U1_06010 [Chloroflexota bacterium]